MKRNREGSHQAGVSLTEALVGVAIIGMIALGAAPVMSTLNRRSTLRAAASELRAIFQLTRSRAIAKGRNVAVKFRQIDGRWVYSIYEDGDWDGVRNDDIAAGRDHVVVASRAVLEGMSTAQIGFPPGGVTDPDTGRAMKGTSPVRFGRSTLCSFALNGSSSPGSIFLTDGADAAMVVRVYGATGKIRALRYDSGSRSWEER